MKVQFSIFCIILVFITTEIFLFSSCKKKDSVLPFTTQNVGEEINLRKIKFLSDSIGFCCGGSKNKYGAIFKTTNSGNNWVKKFSNNKYSINDIFFLNDSIGYACGDSLTLYKTRNGGETWTQLPFPNYPWFQYMVPLNSLYFFSEEKGFFVGGEHYGKGNITRTFNDPNVWGWGHKSYDNEFDCITFTDENTGYASGYGVIYKTTDGGVNFSPCDIRGDWFISLFFFDNNNGFAAGYDGGIYNTSDGGVKWETIDNGNTLFSKRYHFKQIIFSPEKKGYIVGTDGLLLYSDENGKTWKKKEKICDGTLNSICITPGNSIFICSEKGIIYIIKQ